MIMIHYTKVFKQKVRNLRAQGLSYKKIAQRVGISKSTVKWWSQDVALKPEHRSKLYTKQIAIMTQGPQSAHKRRQREIKQIVKKAEKEIVPPIDDTTHKLLGAMLYWAEGDKTTNFALANSDPFLIKFIVNWARKIFKLSLRDFKANLNIYEQQDDKKIKHFWSDLTGIPLENFGKSYIKPKNKKYKKNTLYYGTIKIRVRKGTNLRHRVFGWVNKVLKNDKIEIERVSRKWHKLKTDYARP